MFDNYVFNVEKSEESRGKDKPKVRKKNGGMRDGGITRRWGRKSE